MDKIIAMPMHKSIKKRKNITNLHLKKKKINIDFNYPSCKRCMQKRFVSREKRMRVCRFCSKSLSTNYTLMRHIKTFHKTTPTNRKQYCHGKIVCRFCNKSLSTNYCLNRHIKTFHKTTSTNKKRYCHGKICKRWWRWWWWICRALSKINFKTELLFYDEMCILYKMFLIWI